MEKCHSLEEMQAALLQEKPERVIRRSQDFIQRAAAEQCEEVKTFLINLSIQFPQARSTIFAWLAEFASLDVKFFFLDLLNQDETSAILAVHGLQNMLNYGTMQPGDQEVEQALLRRLAQPEGEIHQEILSLLASLKTVSAIDIIRPFLHNGKSHWTRSAAATALLALNKVVQREDIVQELLQQMREDPEEGVRRKLMLQVKSTYPERLPDIRFEDILSNPFQW